MGQARRRSKKKSEFKLPRLSFSKESLSVSSDRLKAKLAPLKAKWQALPLLHRRGLSVLLPVVGGLMLLPVSEPTSTSTPGQTERRELALDLGNNETSLPPVGQRSEPQSPVRTAVKTPEPASPASQPPVEKAPVEVEWQKYQVKQGETLANIFRDKSLPLTDLYAVAAIEGKDKPLSRIKAGQWLRYKQTAKGGLDVLQIESRKGESVMFFRRSDGSFVRSQ
ncbi:LysM-like peptidoglycan-binding domain-containing protein [Photobacterium kasasachensis]|uniref:LysM-like peptidoglycan-binding domain-containing protein n=1 Tax=Photobacterium kasasachensis TaxID=2910240 RepID=UPI003D13386B